MFNLLKTFNNDYATAISAITPFLLGFISWIYFKIDKEAKMKDGDAANIVEPIFWAAGRRYKILAVHQYEKSDDDVSGYKHLSQNSRPDQWKKLITIKNEFHNHKFTVIPKDQNDILTVIISRNGKEKWRSIHFNH